MDRLEQLIIDMKESLEREISGLRQEMRTGFQSLGVRLDNTETRLDRQGALVQMGSRWTNRMNGWAERVDRALAEKDRELNDVRARLQALERKSPQA